MLSFFRRRRAAVLAGTTFCEACATVCTPACRADARYHRIRAHVLTFAPPIR